MTKNVFSKMQDFANIATDRVAIQVFLSVAKHKVIKIGQLEEETHLPLESINVAIEKLEGGNFVERNPNPASQKFKLGFNGQMFVDQLKIVYPELQEQLGKESHIEPL